MNDKTSRLQDHLGFWLGRLSHEVQAAFIAKLENAAISMPEWCVLIALYHEKQATPAQIAAQIGVDRAAISRTVEKLVQRALIKRKTGQDRRCTPLVLTAQAKRLVPQLAQLADSNDREFFFMLEKEEKDILEKTLLKIALHLGINTDKIACIP